jgi:hypothetical protein
MRIRVVKRQNAKPKTTLRRMVTPAAADFQMQFKEKLAKLHPYSDSHKTIFLIESYDIVLFDPDELQRELRVLFADPHQWKPDEIWFADTAIEDPEFTQMLSC